MHKKLVLLIFMNAHSITAADDHLHNLIAIFKTLEEIEQQEGTTRSSEEELPSKQKTNPKSSSESFIPEYDKILKNASLDVQLVNAALRGTRKSVS